MDDCFHKHWKYFCFYGCKQTCSVMYRTNGVLHELIQFVTHQYRRSWNNEVCSETTWKCQWLRLKKEFISQWSENSNADERHQLKTNLEGNRESFIHYANQWLLLCQEWFCDIKDNFWKLLIRPHLYSEGFERVRQCEFYRKGRGRGREVTQSADPAVHKDEVSSAHMEESRCRERSRSQSM